MSIGIIANPISGKDIRRLVAFATVIDNNEKVNIVKRIILAAQAVGIADIYIMPDSYKIGAAARDALDFEKLLTANIHILEMTVTNSADDTVHAAQLMEEIGVDCLLVLGGDGTSRAAAKGLHNTPLLPMSTGTNNVYPQTLEGTIAGLAAGIVGRLEKKHCCVRDKRIEIYKNDVMVDTALVDVAFSQDEYVGARAIWQSDRIGQVLAVRANVSSIGFSSFVSCVTSVHAEDDFGVLVRQEPTGTPHLVPIAAGVVEKLLISDAQILPLDEPYTYIAPFPTMLALDGEREVFLRKGEKAIFKVTRNGPWRIDITSTLEAGRDAHLF